MTNDNPIINGINNKLTNIALDSRLTLLLTLLAIIVALAAYIGEVRRGMIEKVNETEDDSIKERRKTEAAFLILADAPLVILGLILTFKLVIPNLKKLLLEETIHHNIYEWQAILIWGIFVIGSLALAWFHAREWDKSIDHFLKKSSRVKLNTLSKPTLNTVTRDKQSSIEADRFKRLKYLKVGFYIIFIFIIGGIIFI